LTAPLKKIKVPPMNLSDPNTALLRHYYLQQLGIVTYVPRQHMGESAEAFEAKIEPLLVHVPPLAEIVAPSSASPVITKTREVPLAEAASESVAFQLLFGVAARGVAVVLQLPKQSAPSLKPSEQKLLHNLLHWLGVTSPSAESYRSYQWPLPGFAITNTEAAKRGLQMFLAQAAAESSFQHLVVLGSLPLDGRTDVAAASVSWRCWCAPSLAEMLTVPALKSDAWQSLLPLQQQLISH
jgi:hypothetical protein